MLANIFNPIVGRDRGNLGEFEASLGYKASSQPGKKKVLKRKKNYTLFIGSSLKVNPTGHANHLSRKQSLRKADSSEDMLNVWNNYL